MDSIKISAKNLGQVALSDFCPRCFWIKLKSQFRLPFASFPGIFSSIDAYTKKAIHHMIDSSNERPSRQIKSNGSYFEYPDWLAEIGDIAGYETIKHWSKSLYVDEKSGITLSGVPDDIFIRRDGTKATVDWETAKLSKTQDELMPMYEIQVNVYDIQTNYKSDLYLIYMEPLTEQSDAYDSFIDCGFSMYFSAKVVPIKRDRRIVREALTTVRDISEMPHAPSGKSDCKECEQLDKIISLLHPHVCHVSTIKAVGKYMLAVCYECNNYYLAEIGVHGSAAYDKRYLIPCDEDGNLI